MSVLEIAYMQNKGHRRCLAAMKNATKFSEYDYKVNDIKGMIEYINCNPQIRGHLYYMLYLEICDDNEPVLMPSRFKIYGRF